MLGGHHPTQTRVSGSPPGCSPPAGRLLWRPTTRSSAWASWDLCVDGCIVKAPCGGQAAGPSPVDRGKQGTKRSVMTEGHGIPVGVVVAPANRHDSPLLEPTLERLSRFGFDLPGRCSGASYTRPTASRLRATSCARSPRTAATSPPTRRRPELLWPAGLQHRGPPGRGARQGEEHARPLAQGQGQTRRGTGHHQLEAGPGPARRRLPRPNQPPSLTEPAYTETLTGSGPKGSPRTTA